MHPLFLLLPAFVCAFAAWMFVLSMVEDIDQRMLEARSAEFAQGTIYAIICAAGAIVSAAPAVAWVLS